eukprot:TRINITY_DN36179_c0_g1_i1.p1 TRINITY_DN36179_c0_g1~~TRINITY_DN36179_c0_g1_i1.p1  ORF type:complete len:301 (-),score=54.61 TRINITY_DN36179_c0_g1_i1:58-960(-)
MSGTFWDETQPIGIPEDYALVACFCLLWPLLRFILDRSIFQNIGHFLIFTCGARPEKKTSSKEKEAQLDAKKLTLVKFKESCWKLLYYGASEAYFYNITLSDPSALSTAAFWEAGGAAFSIKANLKLYAIGQFGFYVYGVLALLFWETRRKDFEVMMTHHVATIFLIGVSYFLGYWGIGAIVVALHDASDVFMEAAKLLKYSGQELLASVMFGAFAVSWLLLRLVYFPLWIIYTSSFECLSYVDMSKNVVNYYLINSLLITLLVLHVYWWILIARMIVQQLRNAGRVGDDVRSDSEDEDD